MRAGQRRREAPTVGPRPRPYNGHGEKEGRCGERSEDGQHGWYETTRQEKSEAYWLRPPPADADTTTKQSPRSPRHDNERKKEKRKQARVRNATKAQGKVRRRRAFFLNRVDTDARPFLSFLWSLEGDWGERGRETVLCGVTARLVLAFL
ncbi:hypothetical protein TW95_gp1128 [Pandoravirus inopinatum]|uniref:Uncharacterized protein n=1 Tax=Pandoravirus inopinatum TaxID=1605721 RepID=A0A0B5JDQ0_9VIRU|nr:hypothetical protein TW95_gp1128 [Pandoravirus inopinatum]AJF97862.1 hypothetical protein [Pandoravirus inopinatum]